jgi:pimeloyl-ACP methyl ester carboxylesterase
MIDRFASTNGIELHYLNYSAASGAVMLLLPGLTANAHSFDGLIEAGLSDRLQVLALDLRGRGFSSKPATGYTMSHHAADVIGLMDALDINQAIIGGHSFGGLLTMYLAANYPDRVSKIVVLDAAARLVNPTVIELISPSLERLGKVVASWDVYLTMIKKAPFYQGWWDVTIESYFRADVQINADGSVQARSRPENITEALHGANDEDWFKHLAAIRQPAILIRGTAAFGLSGAPPVVTDEEARETIDLIAGCRYVEVPGNHMTMLYREGARRIVEAISRFVFDK